MPPLTAYPWSSHSTTLVLAIRKGCHYCEASLPFYKRLTELEETGKLHTHVLAIMPDDPNTGAATLQSGSLVVQSVFNQPLDKLRVSGTPTLLLVNAHGRVAKAWIGQLTPQGEAEVITASNADTGSGRPWYKPWLSK